MNDVRLLALKCLINMERDEGYSNILISSFIKDNGLDKRESALFSRLVCGVIERQITLDYAIEQHLTRDKAKLSLDVLCILRMGAYQIYYNDKIPNSAAVDESVKLCRKIGKGSAAGFVNAVLRKLSQIEQIVLPDSNDDYKKYLSVKYSCPMWLVGKWAKQFGIETTEQILNSSLEMPAMYIRVNSLLVSSNELIDILRQEGTTAETTLLNNCLKITNLNGAIENSNAFKTGLFHVQDISSQLCANALGVKPDDTFVDVCAAPGGKSYTAAEIMQNKGEVISCDLHSHRVKLIEDGANRLKIDIIKPIVRDALSESDITNADVVLCDVPCSGLGVIAHKPEIKYKNPDDFKALHDIQYGILCKSSQMVKPHGRLIYSTCTLNRMENESIIKEFLAEHEHFSLCDVRLPDTHDGQAIEGNMINILPQYYDSDGFFFCIMQRDR